MVRSKTDSVERENDLLRFDIQKAAENVARLPLLLSGNQWSALGFVPDQVTASIVSQGILIVTNSVSFLHSTSMKERIHLKNQFKKKNDDHDQYLVRTAIVRIQLLFK